MKEVVNKILLQTYLIKIFPSRSAYLQTGQVHHLALRLATKAFVTLSRFSKFVKLKALSKIFHAQLGN